MIIAGLWSGLWWYNRPRIEYNSKEEQRIRTQLHIIAEAYRNCRADTPLL